MLDLDTDELPQSSSDVDWLASVKKVNLNADAKDWHAYRIIGKVFATANHNIKWTSTKDGVTKENHWTKLCPRLNPETCELTAVYPEGHPEAGKLVQCPECDRAGGSQVKLRYLMNVIDRQDQENGNANPIKVLELPEGIMRKNILDKKKNNKVHGQTYSPAHETYGFDILIKFDKKQQGEAMYTFDSPRGHSPLTDKEKSYTTYNIGAIYADAGVRAANPENLRSFLQRIKLLAYATPQGGTSAVAQGPSFLDAGNSAPVWQMPSTPVVAPQAVVVPFTPPASFATEAFSPPKFAAAPPVQNVESTAPAVAPVSLPVVGSEHPECFKDEEKMGAMPKCRTCPSKLPCFAD